MSEKVIQGDIAEFGDQSTVSLDSIVDETPDGPQEGRIVTSTSSHLRFLASVIPEILSKTYAFKEMSSEIENAMAHDLKGLESVLSKVIHVGQDFSHAGFLRVNVRPDRKNVIKSFLEKTYGEDVKESGIYDVCGLDNTEKADLREFAHLFPQFRALNDLEGRFVRYMDNPYLIVLGLPDKMKTFAVGVLRMIAPAYSNKEIEGKEAEYVRPATLRDIMRYAKAAGKMEMVCEFVNAYLLDSPGALKRVKTEKE